MPPPKSKIPIYPRPVSPLSAESFPFGPQDVIYATSHCSSEEDSSARAAKRRRIEKLGQQYLRGDGLQILSAGLKGPFDNGWKNPWAKQGRGIKRAIFEVPETAGKPVKKLPAPRVDHAKARTSRVEDWLRKNSAYSDIDTEDQSSPTPHCARLVNLQEASLTRRVEKTTSYEVQEPPGELSSRCDARITLEHSNTHHHNPQPPHKPLHSASFSAKDVIPEIAPIERRAWVSHTANADRAEFAVLKSKRGIAQVAPHPTVLSPFDYKRVSGGVQKTRKFEQVADRGKEETESMAPPAANQPLALATKTESQTCVHGAHSKTGSASDVANPPKAVITSTSVAIPALSTDTSHASIANLPSAQPQSLAVPSLSTNNLAIDERILVQHTDLADAIEEPIQVTGSKEAKAAPAAKQDNHQQSKSASEWNTTPLLKSKIHSDIDQTRSPPDVVRGKHGLDTQAAIDDVSIWGFSTVKAASKFQWRATPATVTKFHLEKPTKSASFAQGERASSDSSQGSIKASLKVSKSNALGKENKLFRFGEDTNMHMSDLFTSPVNESSQPTSSPKRLKSALKPSGLTTSTTPLPSTKASTSTGIDGGQNAALVQDEAYDVDGVIDDLLGSYLGTWDAEKEALEA